MDLIDDTYRAAIESLVRCCWEFGLQASGQQVGHHQVWARDSMITLLGARFASDSRIQDALRASVSLLYARRSSNGAIPNNVDCRTMRPNFRAYADGGLWWIIGSTLLAPNPEGAREVLRWYEFQDVDSSGLLSLQEASDWQDLFCARGKGLYLNCLYVLALRTIAPHRAEAVAARIRQHFWYTGDGNILSHLSHTFSSEGTAQVDSLGRPRWAPEKRYLREERYFLPYLGFRAVGEWFDSFGNLLAILAGVADQQQTAIILDFMTRHALDRWPLQSLTPAVLPGDADWRDYYGALNAPHCYHNGGVWPFLGGFYVAALIHAGRFDAAEAALQRLAELNRLGEFNEWHHGVTGEPMGVRDQAWSAGMYLFACECVKRRLVGLW